MSSMTLSERLVLIRKRRQTRQEDIAQVIGCTKQQISNWETGKNIPNAVQLKILADYYAVSADWLLGRE